MVELSPIAFWMLSALSGVGITFTVKALWDVL